MVVGRVTSCSPEQVVELLPARLLRTVLLQQQLLLAPDQLVFGFVLSQEWRPGFPPKSLLSSQLLLLLTHQVDPGST